ncbi:hypothetical protein SRB17_02400 [Streptomyces sp. RB17]|nr:hypothetical protein [Streptomyces sp. RB17]
MSRTGRYTVFPVLGTLLSAAGENGSAGDPSRDGVTG